MKLNRNDIRREFARKVTRRSTKACADAEHATLRGNAAQRGTEIQSIDAFVMVLKKRKIKFKVLKTNGIRERKDLVKGEQLSVVEGTARETTSYEVITNELQQLGLGISKVIDHSQAKMRALP